MESVTYKIVGLSPLLMHNGRLANPLDPIVKQMKPISAKRNKTDADYEQLSKLEFFGSLYLSPDGRLLLPGELWEATLISGAKKERKGSTFRSAVFVDGNPVVDIGFDLGKTEDESANRLWNSGKFTDIRGVRVQSSRVMRTRPVFQQWSCEVEVEFDPGIVNLGDIHSAMGHAGRSVGIGDYRPKFGRFEASRN